MQVRRTEAGYAFLMRAGLNVADFGVVMASGHGHSDDGTPVIMDVATVGHGVSALRCVIMAAIDPTDSPAYRTHLGQGVGDAMAIIGNGIIMSGNALAGLLTMGVGAAVSNIAMAAREAPPPAYNFDRPLPKSITDCLIIELPE